MIVINWYSNFYTLYADTISPINRSNVAHKNVAHQNVTANHWARKIVSLEQNYDGSIGFKSPEN